MTSNNTAPLSIDSPDLLQARGELTLFCRFSSTLLSTMQLNRLLHLILSMLVAEENNLFGRSLLFLYNKKANTLQGMLGVDRAAASGLALTEFDAERPFSGFWCLDDRQLLLQRQSPLSEKIRLTRIDLESGCRLVSTVVEQQKVCLVDRSSCGHCQRCNLVSNFEIESFAAIPLVTRSMMVGVLLVDNWPEQRAIPGHQLELLQILANQASMAIENTRLYRDLETAHAELMDARQRLVHGSHLAAIGEMTASISHELKTPLVAIGGFAARLRRLLPQNAAGEQQCVTTIINESHRLERLLGDILAFARKPAVCYQECNLAEIASSCLDNFRFNLEENGIVSHIDIPDGCWTVLGDANQLKQVCINLIANAQEAMPNGGILQLTLSEESVSGRDYITLTVADSGGGIHEELLERMFNPFFTTKKHGTGLGLAIVSRIISSHSGLLKVRNNKIGAEFKVLLPLAVEGYRREMAQ